MAFKQFTHRLCLLGLLGLLSGCMSLGQVAPAPVTLDLGSAPLVENVTGTDPQATVVIPPLASSPVLQNTGVVWRLGLQGTPNYYATYVWTASPDVMVHARLVDGLSKDFAVLDNGTSDDALTLRVNLLQFEQIFSPDGAQSEGIVSVQAVLLRGTRVLGQWRQTQREAAQSGDAPGGAQALRIATDRIVHELGQWIVQVIQKNR